jgi:hypothetical protein
MGTGVDAVAVASRVPRHVAAARKAEGPAGKRGGAARPPLLQLQCASAIRPGAVHASAAHAAAADARAAGVGWPTPTGRLPTWALFRPCLVP